MYILEEQYLVHYGVKGMKWGVRHDKDRVKSSRKRSNREQSLTQYYMSNGMTRSEAESAAYKRANTEKALKVVGGLSIAALGIYLTRRGIARNVDTYIKAGTKIQSMNTYNPKAIKDAFYGANSSFDKLKYSGYHSKMSLDTDMFGNSQDVYKTIVQPMEKIKVASDRTVLKTMRDMVEKDPDYIRLIKNSVRDADVYTSLGRTFSQNRSIRKAAKDIEAGKITKHVVRAANIVGGNRQSDTATSALYKNLKAKGYGAVRDINDVEMSGMNARTARIYFDGAKMKVTSSVNMSSKEISKKYKSARGLLYTQRFAPVGLATGSVAGTGYAVNKSSKSKKDMAAVKAYRQEHPNSTMSYDEILKTLDKRKG